MSVCRHTVHHPKINVGEILDPKPSSNDNNRIRKIVNSAKRLSASLPPVVDAYVGDMLCLASAVSPKLTV
jgi:hypothetical protein